MGYGTGVGAAYRVGAVMANTEFSTQTDVVFKKTKIHKVINQRTGFEKNLYIKPKKQTIKAKKGINIPSQDIILEGQMSFGEIKREPKPIQNILSKVFSKFKF